VYSVNYNAKYGKARPKLYESKVWCDSRAARSLARGVFVKVQRHFSVEIIAA
jgi:hypothetical protein